MCSVVTIGCWPRVPLAARAVGPLDEGHRSLPGAVMNSGPDYVGGALLWIISTMAAGWWVARVAGYPLSGRVERSGGPDGGRVELPRFNVGDHPLPVPAACHIL